MSSSHPPRASGSRGGGLALALSLAVAGCASARALDEPPGGGTAVRPETALALLEQVEAFYGRLVQRRFNTLETFNDAVLREHFYTADLFFDYYADFAQSLADAHFEQSKPLSFDVEEFVFEEATRARVLVRIEGADGRPLRPGRSALFREDRWQRAEGRWWITPGKL